ncbi:MAG: hypothetical protein ABH868_01795 [bacterium]
MKRKIILTIILVIDLAIIAEASWFIWNRLSEGPRKGVEIASVNSGGEIKTASKPVLKPEATAEKPKLIAKRPRPSAADKEQEAPKTVAEPSVKKLSGETATAAKKPEKKVVVAKKETQPAEVEKIMHARGNVIYGFEASLDGWEIPEWAREKRDHVADNVSLSRDYAKEGQYSLKIDADFPGGGRWTAAIVEIMEYFDWSDYSKITVDIYIPEGATDKLRGEIVMTVGEDWAWTEMVRTLKLNSGQWTTVEANLKPGMSKDWRVGTMDDKFRSDVRKLAVRVTSDNYPVYKGPIYIDNIKVIK